MSITHRLEADVENRSGTIQGEGPLVNLPYLRFGRFLGEAGYFEAEMPLRDPRTDLIQEKASVLRFYWNGEQLFAGVVEATGVVVDNANTLMLPVSGRCLGGAELSEAKIGFLELSSAGSGVTNGPALVLSTADTYTPSTWTLDTAGGHSTTSTAVYAKFAGESALQALRMIADKIGEHWRFHPTDRKVIWMRAATPDSGIRALQGAPDMVQARGNPEICFFESFEERKDVHGLFNQIHPYGAGSFEIATTLGASTRSVPTGFTLSAGGNYLRSDDSITALGLTIPVYVQFPDIRPVSNPPTNADIVAASNALYDAALAMLQRHDSVDDFKVFTLGGIVQLPEDVQPGTTLRVVYEDDRYSVDDDYIVLGIESEIASNAAQRHQLTVAAVNKMPTSSNDSIVNSMQDGRVFQTHPILNVNSYETGFTKFVYRDGATEETAKIYFDFDDEVTQIQQVLFKFETAGGGAMLPLESTVRSVGGVSTTTGSGGAATPTSGASSASTTASGGSSAPTSSSYGANHGHSVTIANGTTGNIVYYNAGSARLEASGGSNITTSNTDLSHTHTVSVPDHTHGMEHTHTVTIADHTHSVTASISAEYGLYRESGSNTFNLDDLRYRVNGGTWANLDDDAVSLSGNRYALDLTSQLYDANFRPVQQHNTLEIARKDSGSFASRKSCTLDCVLKVRNLIQSTAII
jgi:hypothetical protein